jgi:hypothetical protein
MRSLAVVTHAEQTQVVRVARPVAVTAKAQVAATRIVTVVATALTSQLAMRQSLMHQRLSHTVVANTSVHLVSATALVMAAAHLPTKAF